MPKIILLLCISLNYSIMQSQVVSKPKVLIITTGGTIASQTNAASLEGPVLVQAVPKLAQYANIEVEEFVNIGSSKITPELWLKLVKRIDQLLKEKPDLTCIVITHGTDTMEETAFFLNLTHKHSTPIILVGSMRSSDEISADGPANLINAVRVGISKESVGKGVLVVMNDNISAGRDLLKMHNRRVDAFSSTEHGYIGFVDPEKLSFYRAPIKKHTSATDFDIYGLDHLPSVDIIQDFAGIDSSILSYFLQRNNDGLVVSSFAGGRISGGMSELFKLAANHKPIVISSSIKSGRIMGSNPAGTPIIIANDLPANKARILLMLALTQTSDILKIQEYFDEY